MARTIPEENLREKIIESAAELVASSGIARTSLRSICDKAGISTGTLYYYYRSKDLILADILARTLNGPVDIAQKIQREELTREEALRELLDALRKRIEKSNENMIYLHMIDDAFSGNDALLDIVQEQNDDWIDALEEILAYCKGTTTGLEIRSAAILIESTAQGLANQYLFNDDYEQRDETLDEIMNVIERIIEAI